MAAAVSVPKRVPHLVKRDIVQTARVEKGPVSRASLSGAYRDRTGDLRLAKPALSQLS
jgi:hypothetical protein